MTNTTHITEEVYNQLSDTDKAGWREQFEFQNRGETKWIASDITSEDMPFSEFADICFNEYDQATRLVYIPIHPTPDREPEEKNSGWISVKDKLPPVGEEVNVHVITNRFTGVTSLSLYLDGRLNYYWDNNYGRNNYHAFELVTHWQPLPVPPNI